MGEIIDGRFGAGSEPSWKRLLHRAARWHPSTGRPAEADAPRRAVWMAMLDPAEAAALAAVLEEYAAHTGDGSDDNTASIVSIKSLEG